MITTSRVFLAASMLLMSACSTMGMPIMLSYEEAELFQRDGNCIKLTGDRIKKIPGWSKVTAYVNEHWGSDGGLKVNDHKYTDKMVMACMNVQQVTSTWKSEPQCQDSLTDFDSKAMGTDLVISGTKEITRETHASWTTTHSSELTAGAEFTVGIGSDATGKAEAKFSMSTTIKDETTSSKGSSRETKDSFGYNFPVPKGNTCGLKLKVTDCDGQASATVPIVVTGTVWFFYNDAVPDKTDASFGNHYHWSVHLDSILSEQERTSLIELSGGIKTSTKGELLVECKPSEPGAKAITKNLTTGKTLSGGASESKSASDTPKDKSPKDGKPKTGNSTSTKPKTGKPQTGKPKTGKPKVATKPKSGKPKSGAQKPGKKSRAALVERSQW
ncbi:hypothetical protein DFP72DRAFT_904882 [Ephemerocybe angulata]|uniref:Uncharacterized protein n=1 Tax=Ephemerocybe angulata TaxID=980116 RepID=A0A8H6HSN4_9AGAR|nr:hypothetical protein DFP72DRAFT_904882 [Tulosesus angulatus]